MERVDRPVEVAEQPVTLPITLLGRGDSPAPLVFKRGAHPPFAIRWYGVTSLAQQARHLIATAIASESIDSRDWMRPLGSEEMLARVTRVLGAEPRDTLTASLGRAVWIDFIADT